MVQGKLQRFMTPATERPKCECVCPQYLWLGDYSGWHNECSSDRYSLRKQTWHRKLFIFDASSLFCPGFVEPQFLNPMMTSLPILTVESPTPLHPLSSKALVYYTRRQLILISNTWQDGLWNKQGQCQKEANHWILLYNTIAEIVEINGSHQWLNKLSRMENVPG